MRNDPNDFNAPLSPLTAEELREIHEDPAFLAWVDGESLEVAAEEREAA